MVTIQDRCRPTDVRLAFHQKSFSKSSELGRISVSVQRQLKQSKDSSVTKAGYKGFVKSVYVLLHVTTRSVRVTIRADAASATVNASQFFRAGTGGTDDGNFFRKWKRLWLCRVSHLGDIVLNFIPWFIDQFVTDATSVAPAAPTLLGPVTPDATTLPTATVGRLQLRAERLLERRTLRGKIVAVPFPVLLRRRPGRTGCSSYGASASMLAEYIASAGFHKWRRWENEAWRVHVGMNRHEFSFTLVTTPSWSQSVWFRVTAKAQVLKKRKCSSRAVKSIDRIYIELKMEGLAARIGATQVQVHGFGVSSVRL